MVTTTTPRHLLPEFPSFSLVCLGQSNLYSHAAGLQGFLQVRASHAAGLQGFLQVTSFGRDLTRRRALDSPQTRSWLFVGWMV